MFKGYDNYSNVLGVRIIQIFTILNESAHIYKTYQSSVKHQSYYTV